MTLFVNGSFLSREMCGVKRFATNALTQLARGLEKVVLLVPPHSAGQPEYCRGIEIRAIGTQRGTWWEQVELPVYLAAHGSPPLLSMTNNCPIFYGNNVATLHDIIFLAHPSSFSSWKLPFFRLAAAHIVRHARHVLTVSEFSRTEIIRHYRVPSERISVAYNASAFVNGPEKTVACVGDVSPYVLAFHSECEYKNVDFLIRSFDRLAGKGVTLKLVGGQRGRSGNVEFLGRVNDQTLRELYSQAHAFVFPSLYEGFGLPPIEAQSLGCPVLAARIPALVEVLKESAIFFDPTESVDFVRQLNAVLSDDALRKTIREEGFKNAARFCWSDTAKRIQAVMRG